MLRVTDGENEAEGYAGKLTRVALNEFLIESNARVMLNGEENLYK